MLKCLKLFQITAVAGVMSLGLTACHPDLRGGASLSVDANGSPLIGVCHQMPATQARISVDSRDFEPLVEVSGVGYQNLEDGDFLTVAGGTGGIVFEPFDSTVLEPGNTVYLYVYESPGESGETAWATLQIPEEGLQEGLWLFPDGSTWDSVCGAYDATRKRVQEYRERSGQNDE